MSDETRPDPAGSAGRAAAASGFDAAGFREVVRHPCAHALILGQYRVGEQSRARASPSSHAAARGARRSSGCWAAAPDARDPAEASMKFGIFYEHRIPRPWGEGDEHRLFKEALTVAFIDPAEAKYRVDPIIFIQQGGNDRHEDICSSLELLAGRVQPGFEERHEARARRKAEQLAPYVEQAMTKSPPLEAQRQVEPVESYPVLMSRLGVDITQLPQGRDMGPAVQQIRQALAGETPTH